MSKALFKSTAVVSGMTFLSRISGFVRDMVVAQAFGAGSNTDAFFVAFRIPNFLRRLFAEGAFALAFVPVFSEYKQKHSEAELRELIDCVSGTLGWVLFAITVLGVIAAPVLIFVFAPGFSDEPAKYELTVAMLRLTFPYLLFISLVACAGGILNSFARFAVPAFTPVLLNLSLIAAALGLAPQLENPVMALAWGVFIAGLAQLFFQLPYLQRLKLLPRPRWGWRYPAVRRIMQLMLPALVGSSAAQINLLVNTILASFLVSGSVSWLYYTDRLVEFPLGVIGVALGTVILPRLAQQHASTAVAGAAAAGTAFSHTLNWALRCTLVIGLPATVALIILAGPLLSTFFQHGEFGPHDVVMTTRSLMAYALGLLAFMLVKVLAPGFYARQDTRTPVRISLIAIPVNIALSLLLIQPLAHAGLALATALAAYVNAGLLFHSLRREKIYRSDAGWLRFLAQLLAANLSMAVVLWFGAGDLAEWLAAPTWQRVRWLASLVAGGLLSYGAVLLLVGLRPQHLLVRYSQ